MTGPKLPHGVPSQPFQNSRVEELTPEPHCLLYHVGRIARQGGIISGEVRDFFRVQARKIAPPFSHELTIAFNDLLLSSAVFPGLQLLVETQMLHRLIPELLEGQGLEQSFVHPDDVLTHNFRTCSLIAPRLPLRLAGLLHDVGKPGYYVEDPLVGRRFPQHHERSARLIPTILGRFAYSGEVVDKVRLLVENHMFIWRPHEGLSPLYELREQVGSENLSDLVDLITSDRQAIWGEKIAAGNQALWEAVAQISI